MAREQRAARYVPADLDAAEATLQAAREAMAHEDYTLAQQQADEALVQADLAIAKTREAALIEQVREKSDANRQSRLQLGLRGGQCRESHEICCATRPSEPCADRTSGV